MKHHDMKAYGEVEIWLHAFLTSALDGNCLCRFEHLYGHRYLENMNILLGKLFLGK
jgi:hypothetical protein